MRRAGNQTGFTTVELIVVILVAASFIASISQIISQVSRAAIEAHNQDVAGNLAYNNLRKYANGQPPSLWFTCSTANDGKSASNNGLGSVLLSGTPEDTGGLPGPVEQRVTAFAPYGCSPSTNDSGMPIRVISEIKYGNPAKEVIHATYVSY